MRTRPSLSVVIPTFQRPEWIGRAVASLDAQSVQPDEVVVVVRDTDAPSHAAVDAVRRASHAFEVRQGVVSAPGFMPPVERGFALARGEVVATLDDDAEAFPDWAERILSHYDDPTVGAVGGRCINMHEGRPVPVEKTLARVGYVTALGKVVGDMYKEPSFDAPVDADFLLGGCMSFRREIAQRLEFDLELNRVVATGYEVDLGLQARNLGYRVIFDPKVAILHYSAPRVIAGNRVPDDREGVRWTSFNETRVMLRRGRGLRRAVFLTRAVLVGSRRVPGALPLLLGPAARRLGFLTSVAPAAMLGRAHAVATVIRERLPSSRRAP